MDVTGVGIERYIITNLDRDLFYGDYALSCDIKFPIKNFGRDVFLTREEAEAKLKEVQNDDERNVLRVREGV